MPKYSRDAPESSKSCKARGSALRTHYKNAREVGAAIQGMDLKRAKAYVFKPHLFVFVALSLCCFCVLISLYEEEKEEEEDYSLSL